MIKIFGSIKILECKSCNATLPTIAFEGEADTDTMGLCSAGQCNGLEVAVLRATPVEWSQLATGDTSTLQRRANSELERGDLKIATILRVESGNDTPIGKSFAEFREAYRPPIVVYSCACCDGGESIETEEFTVDGFEEIGGKIFSIDGLEISTPR